MAKRALFFCTTMYQLLNVINIKKNMLTSDWEADIVVNDSTDFSEVIPKLKAVNMFNSINVINELDYYSKNNNSVFVRNEKINIAINRNFSAFILWKRYKLSLGRYDAFFVSNLDDIAAIAIYGCLSGKNHKMRLYEYEDGFGTYAKPALTKSKIHIAEKIICALFGKKILSGDEVRCTLLYQPKFSNRRDISLKKIPALNINDRKLYNDIFGYDDTVFEQKYLLFNQYFKEDGFNGNERRLFLKFMEIAGEDNITIKLHPRSVGEFYKDKNLMKLDKKIPWEICMMNQDMDDKVLVTTSSSCVLTSKMIFSSKCKVILLYGISGGYLNMYDKTWNEFMKRFKSYYEEEVFMPKSIDELEKIINKLNCE